MSYFKNPEKVEGTQREVITSDVNTQDLLEQILKELKKITMHLSLLTDEHITNQEVE